MSVAGIYIHVPFCRARCSYCDFATGMYESDLADRYVRMLVKEFKAWNEVREPAAVDTIYFGGGTPSLLAPAQIEKILQAVRDRFEVSDEAEITVEINPGDGGSSAAARQETFREFRRLGINRASFGAQTFDDEQLRRLGRTHAARDIGETFSLLREAGFANINFDLIAGLPGQTLTGWQGNLNQALALRPQHLSLYLLDIHEGTPLADQIRRGAQPAADDDLAAEMYRVMIERVCGAGYEHYEISNFCLPGFESRHNSKYWNGAPYYGFGCSAHSYDGARRRWANERDAGNYAGLIEKGESAIKERTDLSEADARAESLFLGLRLMKGLYFSDYQSRFGVDLREQYDEDLVRLRAAGLIEINKELLRLTPRGALMSNEVFSTFV